jgi:hypothetical protein
MNAFDVWASLKLNTREFDNGLSTAKSNAETSSSGMANSFKKIGSVIAVAFSVAKIVSFGKECLDAYGVQAEQEKKLEVVMKQRMGATDKGIQSVKDYASQLQKIGVVGDEVQLAGAQQVSTFLKSEKSVKTLMPALNNLAVQQKGVNVTTGDMVNYGNMFGKVLQGQTSALKRVGITFDAHEEKLLKTGTEQQRASTLAQIITKNVGNMNEAFAKTDAGKIQQAKNTIGDLKEQIGAKLQPAIANAYQLGAKVMEFITNNVLPAVDKISQAVGPTISSAFNTLSSTVMGVINAVKPVIEGIFNFISQHSTIFSIIASAIGGIAVAVGVVLPIITGVVGTIVGIGTAIMTAFSGVSTVIGGIGAVIGLLGGPVTVIIGIIGALVGVVMYLWNTNKGFRSAVTSIWNGIKTAITTVVHAIAPVVKAVFNGIKVTVTTIFNAIKAVAGPVWNGIKTVIVTVVKAIAPIVKTVFNAIKTTVTTVFNAIKAVAGPVWNGIKTVVLTVVKALSSGIKTGFNAIKTVASTVFGALNNILVKPFKAAWGVISGVVGKIKSAFNFHWSLPSLKLPHISVSGGKPPFGIMGKGSLPSFSIKWYKKAMNTPYMFSGATLFGAGEAGDEIMYGRNNLMRDIKDVVENHGNNFDYDRFTILVRNMVLGIVKELKIEVDNREFARVVRRV